MASFFASGARVAGAGPLAAGGGATAVKAPGVMAAGGGGVQGDLGCGAVCFEPAGEVASESWKYVGNGRGAYQSVQEIQYVGQGGDYDKEKTVSYTGWRCRTCCIVLMIMLIILGIGAVLWLIFGTRSTVKKEEDVFVVSSEPFDCEAAYANWEDAWSTEKKHWCCDYQGRGCKTTTSLPYDCAAGFSNWQNGWSHSKKQWCCEHFSKGCHVVTSKPYDCQVGLSSWESSWSPGKKLWCCGRQKLGCPATKPFDCDAGLFNWEKGWTPAKKAWCCQNEYKGCTTTTSLPYDCNAGFSNWQAGWSMAKQHWCCAYAQKGCTTTTSLPYDCDAGFSNWQAGWSLAKQRWCCQRVGRACVTTTSLPYDCDAGFSNWQVTWSAAKQIWCCADSNKGCSTTTVATTTTAPPQRKFCSLWGDPHIFTFDHSRLVFYSEGDFWIVKSSVLSIQGRFQATDWTKENDHTDYSSMTGILVTGQITKGHKIQIGPMESGSITCDEQMILSTFGTANCGGATITYDTTGKLVDSAMAFLPHRVVHIALPGNVDIQANRWPNFINAQVVMPPMEKQTGICGDFNGVPKRGVTAGKALHAEFGYGVPKSELLFPSSIPLHIPKALPSAKRCPPSKRARAAAICKQEAQGAVGWSEAECLGDVCDPHTTQLTSITAGEMQQQIR